MADATGQDLYGLCLVVERYPQVYEAFRSILLSRWMEAAGSGGKEDFNTRREHTRQQRIQRYR